MLEDLGDETLAETIPISNVSFFATLVNGMNTLTSNVQVNEAVLRKVIDWCVHHKNDPPASSEDDSDSRKKTTDIDEWDQKFMQVDQEMLFEIILVSPQDPWLLYQS